MTIPQHMRKLAVLPVRFYQYCISPLFPGCCRFYPSCSAYAREAVLTHGFFKGAALALWRIARCQPLCKGGFDPVPAPRRKKAGPGPDKPGRACAGNNCGTTRAGLSVYNDPA